MKYRILHYLIRFLVGEDAPSEIVESIGYTNDPSRFSKYNVVIIPSGFFEEEMYGTQASLPQLPLAEVEGIPLLFGTPKEEWIGNTFVVHADIIASTYFMVSRYEEMMRRDARDKHGRFPGRESLPFRAGFLHRPIVDEYRLLLHRWVRHSHQQLPIPEVKHQIRKVYLTHDVDAPTLYRTWKGFVRSLLDQRGLITSLRGKFGAVDNDPYYTFPWLFQQNNRLREALGKAHCEAILFMRGGGNTAFDKPHYKLSDRDLRRLLKKASELDMLIGLHSSYQAGNEPTLIRKEKEVLEAHIHQEIHCNRHHFLDCREPEDMEQIEAAGIMEDFTMGYADVAGFRLGTCHPVRWINPITRRLSPLLLHPLLIMDCSLDAPKYMGLSHDEALTYGLNLIEQVRKVNGELVLLWHNENVMPSSPSYLRELYAELLNELAKKEEQ